MASESFYFEVEIVDGGENDAIGIGITHSDRFTRSGYMPGWNHDFGYHGNNGKMYVNEEYIEAELYTKGDVVGCLVYRSRIEDEEFIVVQFTKNGRKISFPRIMKTTDTNSQFLHWYPTIGIASPGAIVDTNFGEHPFLYLGQGKNC